MKFTFWLFLLLSLTLSADTLHKYKRYLQTYADEQQIRLLLTTFKKAKQFDLQYTMSAILWKESLMGKFPINLRDPSYGPFHALLTTVAKRQKVNTNWSKSRLAEKLLFDFNFAFEQARIELNYWVKYHTKKQKKINYRLVVASYNAGYNCRGKCGQRYVTDIFIRMQAIKWFIQQQGTLRWNKLYLKIFHPP